MTNIASLARSMQYVLTDSANTLARRHGFIQRQRKFTGALFAQTLVFGWLSEKDASLEHLAQTAATLGLKITPQAIDERFTEAAASFLEHLLAQATHLLITGETTTLELLARFPGGVHVLDTSTVALPPELASRWPGLGGRTPEAGRAALKLEVGLNLSNGRLTGPFLWPARTHDQAGLLPRQALPEGALRLADLGYFSLDQFQRLAQQGSFYLSRLKSSCTLLCESGEALDVLAWLRKAEEAGWERLERNVLMGARHRLRCRLLAEHVPDAVASQRRRRLRRAMEQRGRQPSKRSLELCAWTLLVTNVPEEQLGFEEALALMGARWQVELLFKLWKQHGGIAGSQSTNAWRILCEVYAKLLGMLVQHWILLVGLWPRAERSLVKGSRSLRAYAFALAASLASCYRLSRMLTVVIRAMQCGCRINTRSKHPHTFQRLRNPYIDAP